MILKNEWPCWGLGWGRYNYGKSAISEFLTSICKNLEDLTIEGQIPPRELPKFHFAESDVFAQSIQIPCRLWIGQLPLSLLCRMHRRLSFFAAFEFSYRGVWFMSKPFTYWVRLAMVATMCTLVTFSPVSAGQWMERLLHRDACKTQVADCGESADLWESSCLSVPAAPVACSPAPSTACDALPTAPAAVVESTPAVDAPKVTAPKVATPEPAVVTRPPVAQQPKTIVEPAPVVLQPQVVEQPKGVVEPAVRELAPVVADPAPLAVEPAPVADKPAPVVVEPLAPNPFDAPAAKAPAEDFFGDPPAAKAPVADAPAIKAPLDDLFGDAPAADAPAPKAPAADAPAAKAPVDDLFGDAPAVDAPAAKAPVDDLFGDAPNAKAPAVEPDVPAATSTKADLDDLFGNPTAPKSTPAEPSIDDLFGTDPAPAAPAVGAPVESKPAPAVDDLFNSKEKPVAAPGQSLDDLFGKPIATEVKADRPMPTAEIIDDGNFIDSLFGKTPVTSAPAAAKPMAPKSVIEKPSTPAPAVQEPAGSKTPVVDELDALFGVGAYTPDSEFNGAEYRLWVDNSGAYQIKGRLAVIYVDKVKLLKENGKFTTVPLSRLSDADFGYVSWVASNLTGEQTARMVKTESKLSDTDAR